MKARLHLSFVGAARRRLVENALASGLLPAEAASGVRVDGGWNDAGGAAVPATALLPALAETSTDLLAMWGDDAQLHVHPARDHVQIVRSPWEVTPESTLALLGELPFEACTIGRLDAGWWRGYRSIHGWALALRGAGHRLVSPRVLERGPWQRVRDDAHDVTLLRFHDLDVDGDTALGQARPGHALLAPMWLGGHYAPHAWGLRGSVAGAAYKPSFYDRATRTSIVLVNDREVSPEEMGVAAATRIHQVFPDPIDQVAFVYVDEAVARRQLPALWLYGLEVRAITAGGEQRLDLDYQPPSSVL